MRITVVLSDFGADVVRVDRADAGFNVDVLTRYVSTSISTLSKLIFLTSYSGKRSIAVSLKTKEGISLLRTLLGPTIHSSKSTWRADVLIDPFRPGVLERIGLDPKELIKANPKLIVARLTGFRREGEYVVLLSVLPLLIFSNML